MPNTIIPAIQQRLRADADSICFKCFHRKVCRAIDNQPCIECNQFTDANGVTVQQWIPVTERLPKPFTPVLVYRQSFGTLPPYIKVDKMTLWCDDTQVWTDEVGNGNNVTTHWMPLPPAPKGE